MFDHVKFGVSDYAASKAFFLKALEPLGVAVVSEGSPTYGVELSPPEGKASLCLYQTEEKPAHLHLAFRGRESAASRSFLSRGPGGGWQRQWRAWSVPGSTTRTTTQLSSSVRTGTTSKWFAKSPRPNHALQRTELPWGWFRVRALTWPASVAELGHVRRMTRFPKPHQIQTKNNHNENPGRLLLHVWARISVGACR